MQYTLQLEFTERESGGKGKVIAPWGVNSAKMSVRKRSGSGGRRALKEKVVEVYEGLFRGDQIAVGNSNYWEEFFLLKPKIAVLEVREIFLR